MNPKPLCTSQNEWRRVIGESIAEIRSGRAKHSIKPATDGGQTRQLLETYIAGAALPQFQEQRKWVALSEVVAADLRQIAELDERPVSITKPATTAKPAAKPAAPVATPAKSIAAPAGTITAAAFRASQAKPAMSRAEFDKLSHPERNAYIRSGGKLS